MARATAHARGAMASRSHPPPIISLKVRISEISGNPWSGGAWGQARSGTCYGRY